MATTAPTLPPFVPHREDLPWAGPFDGLLGRRCPARLDPADSPDDHGRCELIRHDPRDVGHALGRGQFDVRWRARVWAS